MAQVAVDATAPTFTLTDYQGNEVSLEQFKGEQNVLLIFNRGFF